MDCIPNEVLKRKTQDIPLERLAEARNVKLMPISRGSVHFKTLESRVW